MDLLTNYFPADLAKEVELGAYIKPSFYSDTDRLFTLQNTGEVLSEDKEAKEFKLVPNLKGINHISNDSRHTVFFLTVDAKVVYKNHILDESEPLHIRAFDGLDIIEMSYYSRRVFILTNTGHVYSILSPDEDDEDDMTHHKFALDIVQLLDNLVLDSKGRIYSIDNQTNELVYNKEFVSYILYYRQLMTLNGLYFEDHRDAWYTDRKYNFVKTEEADGPQILLDKKGNIFIDGKTQPGLVNISDFTIKYVDSYYVMYTIDVNNKILTVRWAVKYAITISKLKDDSDKVQQLVPAVWSLDDYNN